MPACSARATMLSLVLLIALGAAAVWVLGNPFADPIPEATARFQRRSDGVTHPQGRDKVIDEAHKKIKALLQYNFKGRPAIEQLIKDLGLTAHLPHAADSSLTTEGRTAYEAMIQSISDGVNVKTEIEDADVELIAVTVRHQDPELAVKIANKLVENYMTLTRHELNNTLLDQKKFFDTELNRYRRKVSELESARLRFAMTTTGAAGVDLNDPLTVQRALRAPDPSKVHAKALRRLNRLRELSKDQPLGDLVILELLKLEAEVEAADKAMIAAEENKEAREIIKRNFAQIRNDYEKIARELREAQEQLTFWSDSLAAAQMALTLNVGDRGLRLSFTQRATLKHPVAIKQTPSQAAQKPAR